MSKKSKADRHSEPSGVTSADGTVWLAERLMVSVKTAEEPMLDVARLAAMAHERGADSREQHPEDAEYTVRSELVVARAVMVMGAAEILVRGPNPLDAAMIRAGKPWSAKTKWDAFGKIRSDEKRNAARIFGGLYGLKKTQRVYEFDPDALAFMETARGLEDLGAMAMAGFKEQAAFIEERGANGCGWLVFWDELDCEAQAYEVSPLLKEVTGCTCLVFVKYDEAKALKYQPTIVPVIPGWTLGKCLAAAKELGAGVQDAEGVARDMRGIAGALYLSTDAVESRIAAERLTESMKIAQKLRGCGLRRIVTAETIAEAARVAKSRDGAAWPVMELAGASQDAHWTGIERAGGNGSEAGAGCRFEHGFDAATLELARAVIQKKQGDWQTWEEGGDVYTLQREVVKRAEVSQADGSGPNFGMLIDYAIQRMRREVKDNGDRGSHFFYTVACQDGSMFAGDFNPGKLVEARGRDLAGDLLSEWVKQRRGVCVAISFTMKPAAPKTKPEQVALLMMMKGHCRAMSFRMSDVLQDKEMEPTVDSESGSGYWQNLLYEVLEEPMIAG